MKRDVSIVCMSKCRVKGRSLSALPTPAHIMYTHTQARTHTHTGPYAVWSDAVNPPRCSDPLRPPAGLPIRLSVALAPCLPLPLPLLPRFSWVPCASCRASRPRRRLNSRAHTANHFTSRHVSLPTPSSPSLPPNPPQDDEPSRPPSASDMQTECVSAARGNAPCCLPLPTHP